MKLNSFSKIKLNEMLKDACLKESINWIEKKSFPTNEDLVKPNERDEMVSFLLEVCDRTDMSFSLDSFALAVNLIDRFLASFKVKTKYLECLAIACLYIACKVKEEDEKVSITSEFLVDCDSKCSISELLRMELMVLAKFEWSVNDVTSADFLYIYHAILVNKYNEIMEKNPINSTNLNKWKPLNNNNKIINNSADISIYPPSDLDFLHLLEYELKQLLCINELTTTFKPRILAFTLLTIHVEKSMHFTIDDSVTSKSFSFDKHHFLKQSIEQELNSLKFNSKISDQVLIECKEKIQSHLATIDANKVLFDRYMDEYYSDMFKNYRVSSKLTYSLSTIDTNLDVIKEEDEEDDSILTNNNNKNVLSSITNNNENHFFSSSSVEVADMVLSSSKSYADILLGKREQRRKISETADEDIEIDYENRLY